jgi:hypothetical protein
MEPDSFIGTQQFMTRQVDSQESRNHDSSPGKAGMDGNYPRELNKSGIIASVLISVVVMVILLLSSV